jgi:hypothetical protein
MEQAKVRLREQHRAQVLIEQADRWRQAQHLRDYVAAARALKQDDHESERETSKWLDWCAAYVADLDPLSKQLRMPTDPKATPEALRPFLNGLSPYGPS